MLQDKVWYKSGPLPQTGKEGETPNEIDATECFTTLRTAYRCNRSLLSAKHGFDRTWERVRPEPEILAQLTEEAKNFWDGLRQIEAVDLVASGKRTCPDFRPQEQEQRGEGHLLFRPIGQEALAEAVARIMLEKKLEFDGITHILKQCNKIDWKLASSPWAGLFYGEPGRMLSDNTRKRQSVGSKLLRYMLGMAWPSADPDLLKEYRAMVYPLNPDSDEAKQLKLPPIIK